MRKIRAGDILLIRDYKKKNEDDEYAFVLGECLSIVPENGNIEALIGHGVKDEEDIILHDVDYFSPRDVFRIGDPLWTT